MVGVVGVVRVVGSKKNFWFKALLSILDYHTKFHPNWTIIGKVSILRWVRRVVGVVASKNLLWI